jgi:cholesterol transport system auxiliary component
MSKRIVSALAVLVCACSALQPPPADPVSTYVLSARPASDRAPRRDVAIEVAASHAWPGYDTSDMVFQRVPYDLERYAVNRWVDTPPRMLTPLVVRALEDSGAFRAIVQQPAATTTDFRLNTEVERLVQDFSARPSAIRIVVRVQLTDVRARRVVATKVFEASEPAVSDDAAGGAAAANAALAHVLAGIVRFCAEDTAR